MPASTVPYDLVIFDCDGVLVDSELLSAEVLMAQLKDVGIDLNFDGFRQHFLGRKFAVAAASLTARTQKTLPENFQALYFEELLRKFETELQPLPGVMQVLKTLKAQSCVASSSLPQRLNCALRVCGLTEYFGPRVFSAALVEQAKPAPDLFLHAARSFEVPPARCLVIEDSEMGILAAQAAGMHVWHFIAGAHIKAGYALPPNLNVEKVVSNMEELHHLFCEIGLSHA